MKLFWVKTKFTWIASLTSFDQIYHDSKIIKYPLPEVRRLCVHLLKIGGDRVAVPFSEGKVLFRFLTDNGEIASFKKIKLEIGEERECHTNSALLWLSNKKKYKIATGFALSDGIWRRHSWVMATKGELIETTVVRDVYFGVTLNREMAKFFAEFYAM